MADMLRIMWNTAMRPSEVCRMEKPFRKRGEPFLATDGRNGHMPTRTERPGLRRIRYRSLSPALLSCQQENPVFVVRFVG